MMDNALTVTQAVEPALDDSDILALIDEEIAVSVSFDNDPDEDARQTALAYYDATRSQMERDVPHVDGWSRVNAKTVQETVDLALPGIMRVFDAPDVVGFLAAPARRRGQRVPGVGIRQLPLGERTQRLPRPLHGRP
jgi:hypothetical protein